VKDSWRAADSKPRNDPSPIGRLRAGRRDPAGMPPLFAVTVGARAMDAYCAWMRGAWES
jgi:hypothetical protein